MEYTMTLSDVYAGNYLFTNTTFEETILIIYNVVDNITITNS